MQVGGKKKAAKRKKPRIRIPVAPPTRVHVPKTAYKREKGKLKRKLREELEEGAP